MSATTPRKSKKSAKAKSQVSDPGITRRASPPEFNPEYLPKRLYATDRYPPDGRINSYSRPEYLLDLAEALEGTREFNYLRASCFGSLFDLPVRKCSLSGKLVHQMLCRALHTKKKHEIWFVFAGQPFRFSLREFPILTGLPCGPYPDRETILKSQTPQDPDNPYWDTLFGKDKSFVNVRDIISWLKKDKTLSPNKKMPDWKRLRLALIVIVEGILICNSQPVRASRQVVEMVKDLEAFEEYPWGRESFSLTLRMVKVSNKISTVDELVSKFNQSHSATHGFTLAFQLLIFKAIPEFESFLPDLDDQHTFTDRSIANLAKLRTFHNFNIMQTENTPNVRYLANTLNSLYLPFLI